MTDHERIAHLETEIKHINKNLKQQAQTNKFMLEMLDRCYELISSTAKDMSEYTQENVQMLSRIRGWLDIQEDNAQAGAQAGTVN